MAVCVCLVAEQVNHFKLLPSINILALFQSHSLTLAAHHINCYNIIVQLVFVSGFLGENAVFCRSYIVAVVVLLCFHFPRCIECVCEHF